MRTRVGVLRGGPSSEYENSLKSGASVLRALPEEKFIPVDIFIDRTGEWHIRGLPIEPYQAVRQIDVAFNALHGKYGEHGMIQRVLETFGVPYTGSDSISSAAMANRGVAKQRAAQNGIRTLRWRVLSVSDDLDKKMMEVFQTFPQPSVVSPLTQDLSGRPVMTHGFHELEKAIQLALENSPKVLIEEYIKGREVVCGVVEQFRGEKNYRLVPAELAYKKDGEVKKVCPSNFTKKENEQLLNLAQKVHELFGARHYSQSEFLISPRGIYFLQLSTQPELSEESVVAKSLEAAGSSLSELSGHLVGLAQQ